MHFIIEQIKLIKEKDPSIHSYLETLLTPSFKANIYYKISHYLYLKKHYFLARFLSEKCKRKTGIEIHPGATIGKNFFIDHGIGTIIGETSIIEDNVTIFHGVTLGAKNTTKGKRHPTIKSNCIIGAHAQILGNITIEENCKIGANATILKNIPQNSTVIETNKIIN